jgi:hypothetical protein
VPRSGACAWWRMLTTFPFSASFGHPLSSARRPPRRIAAGSNGPTKALVPTAPREERRLPEDRDVFDRHDTRRSQSPRRIAPSRLRAGSLAHAARTSSPVETVLLMGLARSRCGHPLIRGVSRVQTPLKLAGTTAPGADDPSAPMSSTDPAVDGD